MRMDLKRQFLTPMWSNSLDNDTILFLKRMRQSLLRKGLCCTITISLYNKVHLSHYGSHNWQVKSRAGRVSNTYVITTDQLKYIGSCQKRIDLCIKTQKFKVVRPCMIKNGRIVSKVTSETFSPSLQTSIDMAYFDNDARQVGSKMRVKARKKEHA